ncbi:MAG: CDP-alcohol phosphatidyltransferase family protein [Chloroflexi bacterium]|nr:CDP-alcohol phosphatidyltransferase family protein [Chloroflexota bacterium]
MLKTSLTSLIREVTRDGLNIIASFLDRLGVNPNLLTILGVIGHLFAAGLIGRGFFFSGALILFIFGLFDALDGALARYQQKTSDFGAFLDSVCDRFSEGFIFLGLLYFFASHSLILGTILVFISGLGALFVSYTRARAESVGVVPTVGIMTRLERYIVLVIALLIDKIVIGLVIIAVLSVITIGQRIWFVYKKLEL